MPDTTRRRWPLPAVIGVIVLLAVAVAVAVTIASPPGRQASDRPTMQPTTAVPASAPATTSPADTSPASPSMQPGLTDGIYQVGREIRAGAYTTTAPAGRAHGCYWARLRSFGQADSVIADHNVEPGESARVVVKATDRGFKVSNGCTWRAELAL